VVLFGQVSGLKHVALDHCRPGNHPRHRRSPARLPGLRDRPPGPLPCNAPLSGHRPGRSPRVTGSSFCNRGPRFCDNPGFRGTRGRRERYGVSPVCDNSGHRGEPGSLPGFGGGCLCHNPSRCRGAGRGLRGTREEFCHVGRTVRYICFLFCRKSSTGCYRCPMPCYRCPALRHRVSTLRDETNRKRRESRPLRYEL
jgi:hypothetical protein